MSFKFLLIFFFIFLASAWVYGQDGLTIYGKMKVEGGRLDGKMEVLENGSRIRIVDVNGSGKFDQKLNLNSNYIFSFSQEGYVTKKIAVNTTVGVDRGEDAFPFAGFEFQVTLFKQYEGVNFVMFNQPVGMVHYNPDIDEFDYDTDYTKSIQERLAEVEKEVEEAKKEEAKKPKEAPKKVEEEKKPKEAPKIVEEEKKPEPVIKEEVSVKREAPPTTPKKRFAPLPPPPRKKKGENVVVLHSYTVGEMKYPNLNAYGFINFGDGAGRREITKEQFDEYAKIYH